MNNQPFTTHQIHPTHDTSQDILIKYINIHHDLCIKIHFPIIHHTKIRQNASFHDTSYPSSIVEHSDEMHQNSSLQNTTKLTQNTSYQIKIKMLPIHNTSKDNRMKYIIIKHIKKSPINKHATKILPAKFIKMNPIQKNIKLHSTKVHQYASYQSASKCILPKHIKMHPTKACWVVIEVFF